MGILILLGEETKDSRWHGGHMAAAAASDKDQAPDGLVPAACACDRSGDNFGL